MVLNPPQDTQVDTQDNAKAPMVGTLRLYAWLVLKWRRVFRVDPPHEC